MESFAWISPTNSYLDQKRRTFFRLSKTFQSFISPRALAYIEIEFFFCLLSVPDGRNIRIESSNSWRGIAFFFSWGIQHFLYSRLVLFIKCLFPPPFFFFFFLQPSLSCAFLTYRRFDEIDQVGPLPPLRLQKGRAAIEYRAGRL